MTNFTPTRGNFCGVEGRPHGGKIYPVIHNDMVARIQDVVNLNNDPEEATKKKELQESFLMDLQDNAALESQSIYQELKRSVLRAGRSAGEPYESFYCPLNKTIMKDPVMVSNNQSYEREAIEHWFNQGNNTDPLTSQPLDRSLTSNRDLRETIGEWLQRSFVVRILSAKEKLSSDVKGEQECALEMLCQLCEENATNVNWIAFEGLIPQISECMRCRSSVMKMKTLTLLRKLVTGNDNWKEELANSGCLETVVSCLLRESSVSQTAAELLLELVTNVVVRTKLGQQKGAILSLVTCFRRERDPIISGTVESILKELSDTDENIKQMAKANFCRPLVNRLHYGPEESKLCMAVALSDMELTDRQREFFVIDGAIPLLVEMLQSARNEMQDSAMKALQNLSLHDSAKRIIVEEGGILHVLEIMSSRKSSSTSKVAAVAMLEHLTSGNGRSFLVDACNASVSVTQVVHDLVGLLGNLSFGVTARPLYTSTLNVLYRLALPPGAHEVQESIREEGVVVLRLLLKEREPHVRDLAVKVLSLLCEGEEGSEWASHWVGDSENLMDLLKDNSVKLEIKVAAAGMLANLPEGDSDAKMPFQDLVNMAGHPNVKAKESAIGALLRFTERDNLQQSLADMGLLPLLVEMLKSSSSKVKAMAALAIKNFSMSSPHLSFPPKKNFLMHLKVPDVCKVHKGRCSVKTSFCLLKLDAVSPLVEVLDDPDGDAAEAAIEALETLLQTDDMKPGVNVLHNVRAIDKLIKLLTSTSPNCSYKSLKLLEQIFKVQEMKDIYGPEVKTPLMSLLRRSLLCHEALKMLKDLGV